MKIEIDIDEKYDDTEIVIHAKKLTADIEKMVSLIRVVNMQIGVNSKDETFLLDIGKILYIEAVDRKTFVYTESETY
ncbi:MAG: LytTR family transcriptional regulator, partial [Lachnospiraceae bacterium]|nr:LytTR family transcriptional regulator [Lachnospiraceae bacterium]